MSVSYNDGILLFSLIYSCVDLQFEWESFNTCARPIHQWLLISYLCVIGFRLTHIMGMQAASSAISTIGGSTDFLLDLRQKGTLPRYLAYFTWVICLPFFIIWALIGTKWLWQVVRETPQCTPTATHLWFSGLWLALCYVWISVHVTLGTMACVLEFRVRRSEEDLRQVADADTVLRWGQVSQLSSYASLPGQKDVGLTPSEIKALPIETVTMDDITEAGGGACECSICINCLEPGDRVRKLPRCGHAFHRSCIDLWLLRRAECPLCKCAVKDSKK
jgi:hypothetical protein